MSGESRTTNKYSGPKVFFTPAAKGAGMTRYSLLAVIIVVTLLIPPAATSARPSDLRKVVVIESSDAPNKIDRERLAFLLVQLAREWKIPSERIPNIVVFHISEETGDALRLGNVSVNRNCGRMALPEYYEVWVKGKAKWQTYLPALEVLLESHANLAPTVAERDRVLERVARYTQNTISTYGE
jgi:hypothetical protein